jgi:WD40 repeat protein
MLASGAYDQLIRLWDMSSLDEPLHTLEGHTNWILDVAFNADGTVLASGSADDTLRLWDVLSGMPLGQPLSDHTDWVRNVAFSPDGLLLASSSHDQTIIMRDPTTGQRLQNIPPMIGHTDRIQSLSISPDSQQLISGDEQGNILVWRTAATRPLLQTNTSINGVAFNADGTQLLIGSSDATARLLDLSTGETVGEPLQADNEVLTVAINGERLAYGDANGRVYLVNGADVTTIDAHVAQVSAVRSVAFSPDGLLLASAGDDMRVRLWDAATGEAVGDVLQGHSDWVMSVTFSPDGSLLASGARDRKIILWDVATGTALAEIETPHTDGIMSVAFSHDGRLLASASRDGSIILWDVATRTPIGLPLSGHDGWVLSVAFNPDDLYLASGGQDETVILWDVATQQIIGQPFTGHENWVLSVAFSPDGSLLASSSRVTIDTDVATVRLWDVSLPSWIERSCAIANRALTVDEWTTYLPGENPRPTC